MSVPVDDAAAFRVLSWLDRLERQHRRLKNLHGALSALDAGADGMKAHSYEMGGKSLARADLIGELVSDREEKRARIYGEIAAIEDELSAAAHDLEAAWTACAGVDDASFAYVLARYAHGVPQADASRDAGMTLWEGRVAARRIAPLVFAAMPQRFAERKVDPTRPWGEWA